MAVGISGLASYDTDTSPAMVIFGVVLCMIFVVPIGIIKSITGIEVTLNVLAEFIGNTYLFVNLLNTADT
jgi:hypothetical protein